MNTEQLPLEIDRLRFSYGGVPLLEQIDLRVEPGRRGVRAVARPYTQPEGLRVRVVARRRTAP